MAISLTFLLIDKTGCILIKSIKYFFFILEIKIDLNCIKSVLIYKIKKIKNMQM